VLRCVAVRCSVLQCVAVYYSAMQCAAVCCSVLQSYKDTSPHANTFVLVLQFMKFSYTYLHIRIIHVNTHVKGLECVAVRCSVLQCVAVCCSHLCIKLVII